SVFKTYQPSGNADLDLIIDTKNGFDLTINFDGLEGKIIHSESAGRADIYSGRGTFSLAQGQTNLNIDGVEAGIGPGRFTTSGEIRNFNSPSFDLALQGRLELEDLKNFLNIRFAEILEGRIDIRGKLEGKIDQTNLSTERLLRGVNFLGEIVLKDGAFKTEGRSQVFKKIEGSFEIVENSIQTKKLTAEVGDNQFEIAGQINNALPYLTGNGGSLEILADLKTKRIYLEQLFGESEGDDNPTAFRLPEKVGFNLNIQVDRLDYKKFTATDLSGKAYYRNGLFTLNPAKMTLSSGSLNGNIRLKQVTGGFELGSNTQLNNMNVDELFVNFDDFGQEVIGHDQIEGIFNGSVDLTCFLDTTLAIRKESVKADVNLKIDNGKLKEVQSLIDIADYIKGNALWNTFIKVDALKKRLRNIEFATLENNLTIENQIITIPEMKIATSVLDISASGTHDFDNNIDYSIGFRLSELLRTGREKDSEFGYVVDDETGLRIFLRMAGTIDNPEFSSDKATAREKRKEKFDEETKTFKGILKEEFGLFKSDTTLSTPTEKVDDTKPVQFEVDFGEPSKTDSLNSKKKKKLSKKDQELYDDLEDDDDM
ncbi:MAG: AsmA-like C-terminal region-containing protein, partial [Cryomorphaceae bacterium]